jgi:hypothetical protein
MVGVFNIIFLLVSMYLCVKIVTPAVIMTYANDNMSYLLMLPASGCLGVSLYLFSHSRFTEDHTWLASVFLIAAILTVLNSLLSWLGGRFKMRRVSAVPCLPPPSHHDMLVSRARPDGYRASLK